MINSMVRRTAVSLIAATSSDAASPAGKRPGTGGLEKAVVAGLGVAAVVRIVRNHRTYERALLVALVLAAAVGATRSGAIRSITRLIEWDKAQDLAWNKEQ